MTGPILQNVLIKRFDEMKLVGFRVLCSGEEYIHEIPKASMRLSKRMNEIKHVMNPSLQYGAFVVENHSAEEDGYWVCIEVKKYEDIPAGMVSLTIPSQRYAILRYQGSNEKIMYAYTNLHKWIEEYKYRRLKDKWHLEIFYSWNDSKNVAVELLDTIE
ncbi:GyrI-like domain-containing protein [Bacillus bingmayongensis]|uniref:GyrI-like domain-containing protein n=1 Tax=Bacillus bingmayongensis TaxID=1150157 RepID=UPI0002D75101|nr:GyrI-like domain-containing protein [Bacillus bingmayongensis]MBY0598499.1 GyrI-like domain-containing protein [Bacillus bingmayongensis]